MKTSRETERSLDAYLLAGLRLGDRNAQDRLVRRWNPKLAAHAWRLLGDRELALDAVQEGWADIVRGLPRLKDDHAFAVWALRIVTRRCAGQIRTRQAQRRLDARARQEPADMDDGLQAELSPDQGRVRAALDALPREQRAAIALFHLQELSVAEVAVALDVPAGTVKTRLMHARRKLRAILEGESDE